MTCVVKSQHYYPGYLPCIINPYTKLVVIVIKNTANDRFSIPSLKLAFDPMLLTFLPFQYLGQLIPPKLKIIDILLVLNMSNTTFFAYIYTTS